MQVKLCICPSMDTRRKDVAFSLLHHAHSCCWLLILLPSG